jgi:hypothetical protein
MSELSYFWCLLNLNIDLSLWSFSGECFSIGTLTDSFDYHIALRKARSNNKVNERNGKNIWTKTTWKIVTKYAC